MDATRETITAICLHCDWREPKEGDVMQQAKQHVVNTGHTINLRGMIEPSTQIQLAS